MQAHDKFQRRSLRDVLVSQGHLPAELADELVTDARSSHEPLAAVVVNSGHMTAWEMVRTVSTHFHMPVLPLAGYLLDTDLAKSVPAPTLYQYHVLPVGRFGKVMSFAAIEPPGRDCIASLQEACGHQGIFFFVAEVPEVQRMLRDNIKVLDAKSDTTWQNIFDEADQSVLDGMGSGAPSSGSAPSSPETGLPPAEG